jgi:hypothetical protein
MTAKRSPLAPLAHLVLEDDHPSPERRPPFFRRVGVWCAAPVSTKPCPQCGTAVPLQARFCGHCGTTTTAEPGPRAVPITLDEATADPAPVAQAPAPTPVIAPAPMPEPKPAPRIGMNTVLGHAAVTPADSKPTAAPPPEAVPLRQAGAPTAVGHAVPPPTFAKTLYDPAPYGATRAPSSGAIPTAEASQRPTPLVPPPQDTLGKTLADPQAAERAAELRDQVLAAATPRTRAQFNKTIMQGGDADAVRAAIAAVPAPTPEPAPAAAPAPSAPMTAAGSDKQTMVGMPSVGMPAPQPAPPAQGAAFPPVQKTMIGVAIPGIAPTHEKPAPSPQQAVPAPSDRAGTLLGIAAPGIAPLNAGAQQRAAFGGTQALPSPPPPPIVPAPAALVMEPIPEPPQLAKKKGISALAVVGIVFALVAVVGAGAAFVILRSGAPLSAQPQLDETGKESLKIRCESCPDGTTIALGASSSKVEGATTLLPLPAPLSIGDNDLEMKIDRPPPGRDETVKVHVPVAYRVKADLSTLAVSPAAITVRVEALAGTEVTVDGKPIALDGSGKGSATIDVAAEVEGPSDESKTIDRKIPFAIKSKAGAVENGQLVVRTGVAPLHLDAPGLELFTDRAAGNVAGQVKPGATVTIDGQNVAVDAQGRFGVRVELPADGEKTIAIVANAPPLAPRTVRAKLVRVAALDAAAKTLDARTPMGFDAYSADPKAKAGQLVLVEGELQYVRGNQGSTIMAVEEKNCAAGSGACVVRVVHGEEVRAVAGDTVRAYGRLQGTTSLNGKTIPDVQGSLVLVTGHANAKSKR